MSPSRHQSVSNQAGRGRVEEMEWRATGRGPQERANDRTKIQSAEMGSDGSNMARSCLPIASYTGSTSAVLTATVLRRNMSRSSPRQAGWSVRGLPRTTTVQSISTRHRHPSEPGGTRGQFRRTETPSLLNHPQMMRMTKQVVQFRTSSVHQTQIKFLS